MTYKNLQNFDKGIGKGEVESSILSGSTTKPFNEINNLGDGHAHGRVPIIRPFGHCFAHSSKE